MITKKQIIKIIIFSLLSGLVLTVLLGIIFQQPVATTTIGCPPGSPPCVPMYATEGGFGYPFVFISRGLNYAALLVDYAIYFFISVVMFSIFYTLKNRTKKK